ncbi:MAG: hypothetical protein P1P82_15445 [Bacteroidales bacterium]|nr:hypothetical protein [Bacteroidales bacterium]MDT8432421.1 hypothetical protein [Bacteroidales bacterium]
MPYRRLPNTDNARIKALNKAFEKGTDLPPFKLAFSQSMYQQVKSVLPNFENAISEHRNAMNLHAEKNKEYHLKMKKAKLYISHFIQVVDMAIARGELNPGIRNQYGLNGEERKLPNLNTEEEIIETGKKLIEGERARKLKGVAPITNPTIAVVQVHYDKFFDAYHNQKGLKRRSNFAQENLATIREKTDAVIQQIWNEVEDTFNDLPEEIRREKAAEYGVVYVFRKHELNGINLFHEQRVERFG